MKFVTIQMNQKNQVALVNDDLTRYWLVSDIVTDFSGNMLDLIERYSELKGALKPEGEGLALKDVRLLAPIPTPRKNIFCVGKNYYEHAEEFGKSGFDNVTAQEEYVPEVPVIFTKAPTSVVPTGSLVPVHSGIATQLDYEAELAVIIGKAGRDISRDRAMEHVFGYTIINDFTARDLQKKHKQWFLGKSLDGFCPMGPCITTADQIDGQSLDVRCWVNGELRQDANTRQLIFDIPTIIETLSAGITLHPGDVIATGTPAGVGLGFTPPRFLRAGDQVRIEIQGIGTLENTVE